MIGLKTKASTLTPSFQLWENGGNTDRNRKHKKKEDMNYRKRY